MRRSVLLWCLRRVWWRLFQVPGRIWPDKRASRFCLTSCVGRARKSAATCGTHSWGAKCSSVAPLTIHSSRHRFAARLNSGVRPERQHVASSGSVLLEAFRDRTLRGKCSRVCLFVIYATSCPQRARMGSCCSSWRATRFYSGIGTICLGVPAQSACSCSWRSASDSGGFGCLVRAQGLTVHSSRCRFAARLNSSVRAQ